ncbi:hypothetical protein HZH68_011800 [Vespula germanica]|uniref:Uncharacterized protein n=1 Tax=Vespula germanica TaxID=30212 RepID=A0A834N0S2_VESGE|nr:hypothetical protein HZH68_011800 [Vespula germanica]
MGNPYIKCMITTHEVPNVECTQNSDCTNDKTCSNNKCIDPCTVQSCGFNSRCYVQMHRAICVCNEDFTGNPQQYCQKIGCRGDNECPLTQSCINDECIDTCQVMQCGINALCTADSYHKARCYCPDKFLGNPYELCKQPECISDNDCAPSLACKNSQCTDPCSCPSSAQCFVINHRPSCQCPPGYTGDPYTSCTLELEEPVPECQTDVDCPSKLACFNAICKDPCIETKPCISSAKCSVVDTLPMRTMICECPRNFMGDATVACIRVDKQIEAICVSDSECSSDMICLNQRCINPCAVNPCASNAECYVENHRRICQCPAGHTGDPFVICFDECPSNKACINRLCQNPCLSNRCGPNAECIVNRHHPTCHCQEGFAGNPQIQCFKPECNTDHDCPYDKACQNGNCFEPCLLSEITCGRGAECITVEHKAQCICPQGKQGHPYVACISTICHYNEDCADHEICDRLNRICRPVCDIETCAETAICVGRDHQPKCTCPTGTSGNPYVECNRIEVQPECLEDIECQSNLACINAQCQDPCGPTNMCTQDQECKVLNTIPLRTIICLCPPNTITNNNGNCIKIELNNVQCHLDHDCNDNEKCLSGRCVEACNTIQCGYNAQCKSTYHTATCVCASEFIGDAYIECTKVTFPPLPPNQPECYSNSDCAQDKQCINSLCLNPCIATKPCGKNSFCHVENHNSICKCPQSYIGDPRVNCIPPKIITECSSNSDCAGNTACFNGVCINPCNCGPNAKCIVANHYPSCVCPHGYSGNPQLGCFKLDCESDNECNDAATCYNGQCINPCILDNKCAINAECYGYNHRSACRCSAGYIGNPQIHCERVECNNNYDCPQNQACKSGRCIDPCVENSPCAQNALCYVQAHLASCRCPVNIPSGNPYSYCERHPPGAVDEPECRIDIDCGDKLVCIRNECIDPCPVLKPCLENARCDVLDTVPVRTMTCTCPEGWITHIDGICRPIQITNIGACVTNDECNDNEACVNRQCRDPCNCGTNAICFVRNHKPICSCKEGYQGNPEIACVSVECQQDYDCALDKSCKNKYCVDPCLLSDLCGLNAECYVRNHVADCRCRKGYYGNPLDKCRVIGCHSNGDCPSEHSFHYTGNPYILCKLEEQPECREDSDCPDRLACFNHKCEEPCPIMQPCTPPSECRVLPTSPIRTMICVCPSGYVSSGSGTCQPTTPIVKVECTKDNDCAQDRSCINGICRNPCTCGPNAICNVVDHKPVCSCILGYDGSADIACTEVTGCHTNDDCSGTHICVRHNCIPACSSTAISCGKGAECRAINHKAICECPPGLKGNPTVSCVLLGCRSNIDCPTNKACINNRCEDPCISNPCTDKTECNVYNHVVECSCPPGYIADSKSGCVKETCKADYECPPQTACFDGECINPCIKIAPCGVNAICKVLDTEPVRTMICDTINVCSPEKGQIRDEYGNCICPQRMAKDQHDICIPCHEDTGMIINNQGYCTCALEKGFLIDEYGRCICPTQDGYKLTANGYCKLIGIIECRIDDDCADNRYCEQTTRTCEDPCSKIVCSVNAFCNATRHQAHCFVKEKTPKTDFPTPDMGVSCLSDGVQVEIYLQDHEFDGVLYVKGRSKDEQCRRVVSIPAETIHKTDIIFKVAFGNCGLIHVNGQASFILVVQKHPKLVTYKAQAYHIKCIYQTGEQNVTLGFNVSMLTTAGTIANTGPPPTCIMKIVTHNGNEINSAEIGDNLMLQVEVQPSSIYGGFARNCVAKTMEDNLENEYIVTDENGCATDPTIFGEWQQDHETQSLMASFNAFKFPSSDNIRFQCNIRVCFGRCQPVNCRGYNAFGRRRRDVEAESNDTALSISDNYEGQLREEITIESNLIFTLERREERLTADPAEVPSAQRVEDICVSMVGFIIALVITALLALVAVAIAVSCWLMAYRRQPKTAGPLPHPPEFPNPLFTTESTILPNLVSLVFLNATPPMTIFFAYALKGLLDQCHSPV